MKVENLQRLLFKFIFHFQTFEVRVSEYEHLNSYDNKPWLHLKLIRHGSTRGFVCGYTLIKGELFKIIVK